MVVNGWWLVGVLQFYVIMGGVKSPDQAHKAWCACDRKVHRRLRNAGFPPDLNPDTDGAGQLVPPSPGAADPTGLTDRRQRRLTSWRFPRPPPRSLSRSISLSQGPARGGSRMETPPRSLPGHRASSARAMGARTARTPARRLPPRPFGRAMSPFHASCDTGVRGMTTAPGLSSALLAGRTQPTAPRR